MHRKERKKLLSPWILIIYPILVCNKVQCQSYTWHHCKKKKKMQSLTHSSCNHIWGRSFICWWSSSQLQKDCICTYLYNSTFKKNLESGFLFIDPSTWIHTINIHTVSIMISFICVLHLQSGKIFCRNSSQIYTS